MTADADIAAGPGGQAPEGWVAGTWTIDPAHTNVSFVARHLMTRVRGTFSEVSGQIVTAAEPSGSSVAAGIAVASVSTGVQMRDNHLRSRIGFSAEGTISRRDFGISFGLAADGTKIVVADKIGISLDVQAFRGDA